MMVSSFTFLALGVAAPGRAEELTAGDIRAEIVGRRVHLLVPFGGEFPLEYRRDGTVEGDGEAVGLGRFLQPKDRGRWWIDGNRLCQRFTAWYDGRPMCFDLTRTGPDTLHWVRDNGQAGDARLGSRVD